MKHRTHPLQPLPPDEAFTPGGVPVEDPHPPEEEFLDNLMFESNSYKIEHYRSVAQQLANEKGCAVLLHYYALPAFQHTEPTMMAALIPADEGKIEAPPPAASKSNAQHKLW